MELSNINSLSVSNKSTSGGSFSISDFNMFLQMLTTQMKNQDPLNPIDSADYALQLATFSNVEQAVLTNQLLDEIKDDIRSSGFSDLSSLIGHEALSVGAIRLNGSPIQIFPNFPPGVNRAILTVQDESGSIVSREAVALNQENYTWRGVDSSGGPLQNGKYILKMESYIDDLLISSDDVAHYSKIIEIQNIESGRIILDNGAKLNPSELMGVRNVEW